MNINEIAQRITKSINNNPDEWIIYHPGILAEITHMPSKVQIFAHYNADEEFNIDVWHAEIIGGQADFDIDEKISKNLRCACSKFMTETYPLEQRDNTYFLSRKIEHFKIGE